MNIQNTKAIARKTGRKVEDVLAILRDLDIELRYRKENRYWEIVGLADAKMVLSYLSN